MTHPLITPFPGGKSGSRYHRTFGGHRQSLICDRPGYYDCYVAPFFGGGGDTFGHLHGCPVAIGADADPGVRAVMECWGREKERKAVASLLDWHKNQILKDALLHFESLIEAGNNGYFCMSAVAAAASYLTLKRLTFGGVLRSSKQGKLNVALSADKLEKFLAKGHKHRKRCALTPSIFPDKDMGDDYWGWRYEWPTSTIQTLDVHDHWRGAVEALANGPHERALVTIDPPYYSPKQWVETRQDGSKRVSKMTPAYGNHNPQADLDLCVDPLDAVLATGKAARIVLFNYWSEELHVQIVERVGANGGCSLFAQSNLGPLGGMNQAQQFHGRDIEAVWEILLEIGGKRMFQDHDALKQMELAQV